MFGHLGGAESQEVEQLVQVAQARFAGAGVEILVPDLQPRHVERGERVVDELGGILAVSVVPHHAVDGQGRKLAVALGHLGEDLAGIVLEPGALRFGDELRHEA